MLQWGAYKEGKLDVSKIQICEYGIGSLLVCISRKALYKVIEAKQCLYPLPPPPQQQFYSTNAYFRPLGLFFLFYLKMPAYPIILQI